MTFGLTKQTFKERFIMEDGYIPGTDIKKTPYDIDPLNFEKRISVFVGPLILQNDKLPEIMKYRSYLRLITSAVKHGKTTEKRQINLIFAMYLMEVESDEGI